MQEDVLEINSKEGDEDILQKYFALS